MLSFKPVFSLSFTFIKKLCSFSLLSAVRVISSAYLRLLISPPAILIPACASSSPVFCTMYSMYSACKFAHPETAVLLLSFPSSRSYSYNSCSWLLHLLCWVVEGLRTRRNHKNLEHQNFLERIEKPAGKTLCDDEPRSSEILGVSGKV